jgi:acyl-coenzyme A thioesterase PaaI-like protein
MSIVHPSKTPESEAYFRSIPWVAAYLDSQDYNPIRTISRRVHKHSAHTLFSITLATKDTIPHVLSICKNPSPNHAITETQTFFALGSGMNGHVDIAHGGTVATILDEVAGLMLRVGKQPDGNPFDPAFTAYLNVKYRRPLRTPGVIRARAVIERVVGRKTYVRTEIFEESGEMVASGDAMFVKEKEKDSLVDARGQEFVRAEMEGMVKGSGEGLTEKGKL